jgi:hypothetical protein
MVGSTSAFAADAPAAAPALTPVQARPADSLVDSYGVVTHLTYDSYRDLPQVTEKLTELGVRHLRTRLYANNKYEYEAMRSLAALGMRFNVVMGTPIAEKQTPEILVNTLVKEMPSGVVESVEGANEWNLKDRPNWVSELRAHQKRLYTAVKSNPVTRDLPVLAPALGMRKGYTELGDLSAYSDFGNNHLYPGGQQPSARIDETTAAERAVVGDKPIYYTEAGYHNALNTSGTHFPTTEAAAGTYAPQLLLEHFIRGTVRVYNYELLDEGSDPGKSDQEDNFGLVRHDFTPKPAFTAMKNLLALAADPGPAFTPGSLAYRVDGAPSDLRQVLLQKRDGRFLLLLWREASVYDRVAKKPLTVTPAKLSVELASPATVSQYRPSVAAAAATTTAGTTIPVSLAGELTALDIAPAAVPGTPGDVQAVGGHQSATVSWAPPASTGSTPLTGFHVTATPGGATVTVPATSTSATVPGLATGTTYTFSVAAVNEAGASAPATTEPVTLLAAVPSAPTDVQAAAGDGSALVSWSPSATDGGSPITGYRVTSTPGGAVVDAAADATSVRVPGLTNGTSYTFSVQALNAAGSSSASTSSSVVPVTVPGAPTSATALPADRSATVSWAAPTSTGGSPITGYSVTSQPGGLTATAAADATSVTVPGLTNGVSYTFSVVARNAVGTSTGATTAAVAPRTVPDAPTAVSAARGNGSAVVSWGAPASDGGTPVTRYVVTSSPGGASVSVSAEARTATVTGLTNGTTYTFTVTAVNAAGTSAAATSGAVAPATVPAPPAQPTAVAGDGSAVVSWKAPSSTGGSAITGYTVTSVPGGASATVPAGVTSVTLTGLTNGTSYAFQVVATNAVGASTAATSAAVVPAGPPSAPTSVKAVAGTSSATVSWKLPLSTGGARMTGYTVVAQPGGATVSVDAAKRKAVVPKLAAGKSYRFTVFATNAAGTSPAATTTAVKPLARAGSITPAGVDGWTALTSPVVGPVWSSKQRGDVSTIRFTGSAVTWKTVAGPAQGMAQVAVDGRVVAVVDLYAPKAKAVAKKYTRLGRGQHQLTVTVLGQKNARATTKAVAIAGFKVGSRTFSADRATYATQETLAALGYQGSSTGRTSGIVIPSALRRLGGGVLR